MSEAFDPEILLIYCSRVLANGEYLPEGIQGGAGFKVRFVMMPCSSKIETRYLIKLIEQGADRVELVACPGKQCQFTVGSSRAEHRVKHARALLEEVGMSGDRLGMVRRSGLSADDVMAIAAGCADRVRPHGRNPIKVAR
ncbi:MAG: hydrogenase iron-sulfur subunit [Dehalococcoidia bacterium]|nr:MAG: hydrogenase iron-sulfur subunit [Dehalococcoidia bacterium]